MLAQNIVARACGFLSQLVLAALLDPADFGLIGLTYTVTTIISTLTSVGVEDIVLQRKRTLLVWSGAAFWINLTLSSAGAVLVLIAAPIAGIAYHNSHLFGLLAVLALSMPLGALSSVPGMIMRAEMKFGTFAAYGSLEIIVQSLMTVGLAWRGYGAYSFVIPAPVLAVIRAAAWWWLIETKPTLKAQRKRWKYLVQNTTAAFLSRIIVSFIGQGDYMVLGLLANESVVGRYYFGFRLAAQPLWVLAGNLGGVLYPTLIQLKADPERQGRAALDASVMLSYCVMPLAFIQAAIAEPVLNGFFGQKWLLAIPIIQILSIGLALDAVSWIAGTLLAARGEFVVGLRFVVVQLPVFFALVFVGAFVDQGVGVATAVCLFYALTQPIFVYGVYKRVGVSLRQVASMYLTPTFLAAFAVGLSLLLTKTFLPIVHPLLITLAICLSSSLFYAVLVKTFARETWAQLIRHLSALLASKATY
jgi:O-antigen/teichoic acid export membrane protein